MTTPFLLLSDEDNVLVAMRHVKAGSSIDIEGITVSLALDIPLAHKIARRDIAEGETVRKYGMPIGVATAAIAQGEHVHVHNIRSAYTPTYALQDADGRDSAVNAKVGAA
ncbi:UxaA family hydrolase [Roseibium suaedae]|uniref:SAF domain-containing protein n=1 Tax=Roseibium suaedae TaxID=735517 RepID=A0A1M7HCB0_9HYPH|nr:UxaA family hydrolase [Roseibium suaedae]SHM26080.1 SAF domain-containing protein [Roseibium suaedae]